MLPLLLVCVMHFGLRSFDVGPETRLCLANTTMVLLRRGTPTDALEVAQPVNGALTALMYGKDRHHFSISDECIVMKSNTSEMVDAWFLPRDMCPDTNILNVYGYSYKYKLSVKSSEVTCLFFASVESKHHISVTSSGENASVTAQFFTAKSLNAGMERCRCSGGGGCSFSAMEPFVVRLSSSADSASMDVSMVSLQKSSFVAKCDVEGVDPVGSVKTGRPKSVTRDEWCSTPLADVAVLWIYVSMITVGMLVALVALHLCGYMNWGVFCGCNDKGRFVGLETDTIAHVVVNPSDVLDPLDGMH